MERIPKVGEKLQVTVNGELHCVEEIEKVSEEGMVCHNCGPAPIPIHMCHWQTSRWVMSITTKERNAEHEASCLKQSQAPKLADESVPRRVAATVENLRDNEQHHVDGNGGEVRGTRFERRSRPATNR